MKSRTTLILLVILTFGQLIFSQSGEVKDDNYKFTFNLPDSWEKKEVKETADKDGISYSFEKKDKQCAIMLLAFKITAVKNLDDFVYVMEKDVDLNIPTRNGDYALFDQNSFDGKSAAYKDNTTVERIYYYRTKLADAPYNYAYMLRFITSDQFMNPQLDGEIKAISYSFKPTLTMD